ncbi:MAG TPA: hypothetical protein VIM61_11810 [Chthoniobacterales bacterium]|jgi:Spy/CpxP family protein refolding chaperone
MKKLFLIALATLSVAALHAADPAATNTEPAAAQADQQTPPGKERGWKHHRDDKGGMVPDGKDWRNKGMHRGGPMGPKGFRGMGGPGGERCGDHPMADALKLTDEQKAKAKELMEAARPKIEAIRKEEGAKIKAVLDETRKELRPLLTPEQQAVFDKMEKVRAAQSDLATAKKALDAAQPAVADKKDAPAAGKN